MDSNTGYQHRGPPRSQWPARQASPAQPQTRGFGRPAAQPPTRRFMAQPGRGFSTRQGFQLPSSLPGPGFGGSQGRDCSPQSRSYGPDSPYRQHGIPGSQTSTGLLSPRQLPLRDRVHAALGPRHHSCSQPAQPFLDSQQGDTECEPHPTFLPFDSKQSQQELQMQLQQQPLQPPQRQPQSRAPSTPQEAFDPDMTQASSLPDSSRDNAAAQSMPPLAEVAVASAGSVTPAEFQELMQQVGHLSAKLTQLEGSMGQVSSSTAANERKLAGVQSSCALVLKSVQALLKQKALAASPVTHDQAVQTCALPLASAAIQTSPVPRAPVASAAVQTVCQPAVAVASAAVQTSAACTAEPVDMAVQAAAPAGHSAAVQTSPPRQQEQHTSMLEQGRRVSAPQGLLMLGQAAGCKPAVGVVDLLKQRVSAARRPLQPTQQPPQAPAAAGAGRWNLRKRKTMQQHPSEAYLGRNTSVCGALSSGKVGAESRSLAAAHETGPKMPQAPLPHQSCAAEQAEPCKTRRRDKKRQLAEPHEQPAAYLLECPTAAAAAAAAAANQIQLDVLDVLDDEIARKVQRRLQRHRDKQQRLRL